MPDPAEAGLDDVSTENTNQQLEPIDGLPGCRTGITIIHVTEQALYEVQSTVYFKSEVSASEMAYMASFTLARMTI